MALRQPISTEECVYFTRRSTGRGNVKAWVFRENCTKCKEGLMGKPKDPKTGKTKIRAKEYVCPKCNYTVEQGEYEDTLTANIEYRCPYCSYVGEAQVRFKRKKIKIFGESEQKKKLVDALRFTCSKCGKNIDITKKMK